MLTRPVTELFPRTWLISEYKLVNLFLLEGNDHALLIDTGSGIGRAVDTVQQITSKPLIVVATHGHYDHDGGASLFDAIYEHPDDLDSSLEGERSGRTAKQFYARSRGEFRNPGHGEELAAMALPDKPMHRLPLADGQLFQLGGRTVETILTPGHTRGSVCFLDPESRGLFTGDMCNDESLLLNFKNVSTTVAQYNASLRHLWAREREYDWLGLGHGTIERFDKAIIPEYIAVTDKLLSGEAVGAPCDDGIHQGFAYREGRILIFYIP